MNSQNRNRRIMISICNLAHLFLIALDFNHSIEKWVDKFSCHHDIISYVRSYVPQNDFEIL